jgi:hypothetical protein
MSWFSKKSSEKSNNKFLQPLHEIFPEIFEWQEGDTIDLPRFVGSYKGATENSIIVEIGMFNKLREISAEDKDFPYWKNLSLIQRKLKEKLTHNQYNKFLKTCAEEYKKLNSNLDNIPQIV